ncbi:MAG: YdbL family protein [Methylotenera sp.]|nr:YdbL family protein [Methylotenera sp.]
MKKILASFVLLFSTLFACQFAVAAADLEVNTPAISAIKGSMQARHGQLAAHYASGAVGLTKDGLIAVRDANAVPLKDRASLNAAVAAENADRSKLYKEIATANGHPEWQPEIQSTFASRWIDKAQGGWWYQGASGWVKK